MPKLNQVIALANGRKSRTQSHLATISGHLGKGELFAGLSRVYKPRDEDGEQFMPERKLVQLSAGSCLASAFNELRDEWDMVRALDRGNCEAQADVVVEGRVLLGQVPVTHLLYLEKQLAVVHALVEAAPNLDPAESWRFDPNLGSYVSDATVTNKTKRVLRNHVKSEATDRHPAQVETYAEDITIGYWHSTKFSGALPATKKADMLRRIQQLRDAVKIAREQANATDATIRPGSEELFHFIAGSKPAAATEVA